MVADFVDLKNVIQAWVDKELDHKMILRRDDPLVRRLQELGEPVYILEVNPTAENIAKAIYDYASAQGLRVTQVRLWETYSSYATYRPQDEG
jgi:6-pyruvoyltetrahydropterin/6-carboxytetrahydropterin synthase